MRGLWGYLGRFLSLVRDTVVPWRRERAIRCAKWGCGNYLHRTSPWGCGPVCMVCRYGLRAVAWETDNE